MVQKWKDTCCSPYTWRNLIEAVSEPGLGMKNKPDEIRSMLSEDKIYKKYSKK